MIRIEIDKENDTVKITDAEDRFVILKYSESIEIVEKTIRSIIKDML